MSRINWKGMRWVLGSLDWTLIFSVIALLVIGMVLIYSATYRHFDNNYVVRQLTWTVLGIGIAIVVVAIPDYTFRQMAEIFFVTALALVLLVYFFGTKAFGARRWLPVLGVRIQPSEFLKVATILMLAKYTERYKEEINSPSALMVLGVISGSAFVSILKQPDLGTAMTILAISAGIVFIAGIDMLLVACLFCLCCVPLLCPMGCMALGWSVSWSTVIPVAAAIGLLFFLIVVTIRLARINIPVFAPLVVCLALIGGVLLSPVVFGRLNPYQRLRLTSFLTPEADPRGAGYNLIQSMIAVGSGGLWGKGLYRGSQNVLGFLPHKHTDFIFSVLAEECGFIGVLFLISLLGVLLARALAIAACARSLFGTYVSVGIASMFAFHFFVNMGMTLGMMPITGLPLLFVSYGGSALLSSMFCVGLLLNVSLRRERFVF